MAGGSLGRGGVGFRKWKGSTYVDVRGPRTGRAHRRFGGIERVVFAGEVGGGLGRGADPHGAFTHRPSPTPPQRTQTRVTGTSVAVCTNHEIPIGWLFKYHMTRPFSTHNHLTLHPRPISNVQKCLCRRLLLVIRHVVVFCDNLQ